MTTEPTESIRAILQRICPTDADLDAFCIDYFPNIAARFTGGMDGVQKLNLLLWCADRDSLIESIRRQQDLRAIHRKAQSLERRILVSHEQHWALEQPVGELVAMLQRRREELWSTLQNRCLAELEQAEACALLEKLERLDSQYATALSRSFYILATELSHEAFRIFNRIESLLRLDPFPREPVPASLCSESTAHSKPTTHSDYPPASVLNRRAQRSGRMRYVVAGPMLAAA